MNTVPTLIIGNKNYSSWSLRPWLVMAHTGIAFEELRIPLYAPGSREHILQFSPAGKVPVLIDGDVVVWDSLAICEYLAEQHPQLWPQDVVARAHARSICAEMHSGFTELRRAMPMNCKASLPGLGRTPAVEYDIFRITAIWQDCRSRYAGGGEFLFGRFSIADAMYAPVVLRLRSYGVGLPPESQRWAEMIVALPAMQQWIAAGRAETEVLPQFETHP